MFSLHQEGLKAPGLDEPVLAPEPFLLATNHLAADLAGREVRGRLLDDSRSKASDEPSDEARFRLFHGAFLCASRPAAASSDPSVNSATEATGGGNPSDAVERGA